MGQRYKRNEQNQAIVAGCLVYRQLRRGRGALTDSDGLNPAGAVQLWSPGVARAGRGWDDGVHDGSPHVCTKGSEARRFLLRSARVLARPDGVAEADPALGAGLEAGDDGETPAIPQPPSGQNASRMLSGLEIAGAFFV
jgi:hypothetical protein